MILITSPRQVCTKVCCQPDWPRKTNLSSSSECKGSGIVRDNRSAKTVEASENETPCFVRFSSFSSSHSNVKLVPDNIRRHEKRRKALNFVYLTFFESPNITVLQLLKRTCCVWDCTRLRLVSNYLKLKFVLTSCHKTRTATFAGSRNLLDVIGRGERIRT